MTVIFELPTASLNFSTVAVCSSARACPSQSEREEELSGRRAPDLPGVRAKVILQRKTAVSSVRSTPSPSPSPPAATVGI